MKIKLAQLRQLIREEVESARFLDGEMDDEGGMAKGRLAKMAAMAQRLESMMKSGDQIPAWAQDLLASSHENLQHVHDYIVGLGERGD
jgi:hypothetical protein